jgi:hypothetical protein
MNDIIRTDTRFQDLGWERDTLDRVAQASAETGIEAWASTGLFSRPFFNGRFGITQNSFDKDICVKTEAEAPVLWDCLMAHWPNMRWSVFSADRENRDYGVSDPCWMIQFGRPLLHRLGACRARNDSVEIVTVEAALASLQDGTLEINPQAPMTEQAASSAIARVEKSVGEYPFLLLGPALRQLVLDKGPALGWIYHHALNESGIRKARPGHVEGAFAYPDIVALPAPLEDIRAARLQAEKMGAAYHAPAVLPTETRRWSRFFYNEAEEPVFREWAINQFRSRTPLTGRDRFIVYNRDDLIPAVSSALIQAGQYPAVSFGKAVEMAMLYPGSADADAPLAERRVRSIFDVYARYAALLPDYAFPGEDVLQAVLKTVGHPHA